MMVIRRRLRLPTLDIWAVALSIVFLAALALRLYGIDWDDGADLHPDELFIAKIVLIDRIRFDWPPDLGTLLDPARSGLNPRSADPATGQFREFAYGALPLWVTDAAAWALSRLTGVDWNAMDHAYLVGRAISAVLSALTILPIAALGTSLGGRGVGLMAALFAALAPMSIQLAHFFTTDSWLTFFVALCLLACVRAARNGRALRFAAAGAAFGLAMATKGSVFALAVPIATALLIDARYRFDRRDTSSVSRSLATNALAAAVSAAIAFFAFEPYALLRPQVYLQSLRTQADIVSGTFDVPFTRVYAATVPLAYQIEQFVRWGYGPAAGVLAIVGIALLLGLAIRGRSMTAIVLGSWVAVYGGVLLLADVKFLRYLEPLAPVFAVGAALALSRLGGAVRLTWPRLPSVAIPLLALTLTFAWTGAFLSIYAHENPRLSASHWIYGTVPPGSNLTAEYWDDALPRTLAYALSPSSFGFGTITLDLYRDLPPTEARDAIYTSISRADYVIQSSQRVESAMRAAPWRYPVQGRYFAQLADGALGFQTVAKFVRSPAVGNLAIDDRRADESFINYDHPRVTIYERAAQLARTNYDAVMSWAMQRPWYAAREPAKPTLLLNGPVGQNPSVSDGRWSAALTGTTPVAVAVWVVLLLALLAIGVPIARLLLPTFPDQGWGLARTLALVAAAYPVWLGASLQLFRFRAVWVILAIVAIGAIGWRVALRRDKPVEGSSTRAHFSTPASGSGLLDSSTQFIWLHAEAAFWLVFLIFLAFRLINPDSWHPFWGGEKPMEFAEINAIARSAYFPPYDPWFSDGYLNYYYYGFYLVAFLLKATGIPAEIGFNLALPTMMGILASGGFTVAAALARGLTRSSRLALLGGWSGVLALCLLGNLSALSRLLEGIPARIDPFLFWTWGGSRAIDDVITEFPYFTGLYADLHAHVVALPLTVATIGICLAIATTRMSETPRLPAVARLTALALLLGSLSATNAWDVPVYAVLGAVSVFMATATVKPISKRLVALIAGLLISLGGAWLLFLPFHLHFVALFSQLALVRDPTDLLQFLSHLGGLIIVAALGLVVLLLPRRRQTQLNTGAALGVMALVALGVVALSLGRGSTEHTIGAILLIAAISGLPLVASWLMSTSGREPMCWSTRFSAVLILISALLAVASVLTGRAVFGLLFALGGAAAVGWLRLDRRVDRFVCLLVAAASFTAAGVEIFVIADDLIGTTAYRMNTVFKFYNQVWVLLSLAGAALFALMIQEVRRTVRHRPSTRAFPTIRGPWGRLGASATLCVFLASLIYPLVATGPRLAQRFTPGTPVGTLNAFAWMDAGTVPVVGSPASKEIQYAGDEDAIAWFFANVSGSPVVAEASIGPYRCNGSRISAATGLPTIIGWERHEEQQRYPETLPARVADVRTLYTSPDPDEKASILRRYNVEYVVVGDLERIYPVANNDCTPSGSQAGIDAFDAMIGTTLEVAYESRGTTIYRVLPVRPA
jgi:YYY domain-containing protein